jgi:hypothetical protein
MQRKYILWYREHILCRGQKSTIIEKRKKKERYVTRKKVKKDI